MKISEFLSENFQFFRGEIFNIFEWACFRNECVPRFLYSRAESYKAYLTFNGPSPLTLRMPFKITKYTGIRGSE